MTSGATNGLRADREALIEICSGLSREQWAAPSGCEGWSVQDVVSHMAALFWMAVDGSQLPDTSDLATEAAQDFIVKSRREMSPSEVLDDYIAVSARALDVVAGLEEQDFELALGDLGTYPASVVPNAYTFDHYTHIRADLFSPRGPLQGSPPPSDELRVAPTLDWIEAALPQHSADAVAKLPGGVELVVVGIAPRTISVGDGPVVASIESDAPSLVRWVTQRGRWEDLGVKADGDPDALSVAASFKVF